MTTYLPQIGDTLKKMISVEFGEVRPDAVLLMEASSGPQGRQGEFRFMKLGTSDQTDTPARMGRIKEVLTEFGVPQGKIQGGDYGVILTVANTPETLARISKAKDVLADRKTQELVKSAMAQVNAMHGRAGVEGEDALRMKLSALEAITPKVRASSTLTARSEAGRGAARS